MIDIVLSRTKLTHIPSVAAFLSSINLFFSGCFVPILAIYPTIIICIVALNRSPIDGGLACATPSSLSANLLPSIVFEDPSKTSSSSGGSAIPSASEDHSIIASIASHTSDTPVCGTDKVVRV
uniref:Lipase ATG15 ) n=1 Tax=Ganoderma boninense TaxID=34458 RepID=A0A5K1JTN3_9APHY|nr:Putative lipase ATG15 (EC (Autophagy-related protein 15) [Ganoderma boninense]